MTIWETENEDVKSGRGHRDGGEEVSVNDDLTDGGISPHMRCSLRYRLSLGSLEKQVNRIHGAGGGGRRRERVTTRNWSMWLWRLLSAYWMI